MQHPDRRTSVGPRVVERGHGLHIAEATADGVEQDGRSVGLQASVPSRCLTDRSEQTDRALFVGEGAGAPSSGVHQLVCAGCRFVSDNGTEVDVDFAADGSEVFDLWRLRGYGLSLPEPLDVTDQEMRSAV